MSSNADSILGSLLTPTTPILDAALKEAAVVPVVPKDTAQAGVVDVNGQVVFEAQIDKSLGKDGKFGDVIGQAEDSQATGWKFGAWWKKTWGGK